MGFLRKCTRFIGNDSAFLALLLLAILLFREVAHGDPAIATLLFAVAVTTWAVIVWASTIYELFRRFLSPRGSRVERQLAAIFHLDTSDLARVDTSEIEWTTAKLACLNNMYRMKSYCARIIVQDFAKNRLADRDFMQFAWRLDFAEPDGWHVTQQCVAEDGPDLWDEWISISGDNYQHMGIWVQTARGRNESLNHKLSIGLFLDVVTQVTPHSAHAYQRGPLAYFVADYSWDSVKALTSRYWGLGVEDAELNLAASKLEVWIDINSNRIMKGVFTVPDGPNRNRTSQSFCCFDEDIHISQPPWLNGVLNDFGTFTVLDTRVAVMPHHC